MTLTSHVPNDLDAGTETFTLGSTTLCSDASVGVDGTATCTTTALPAGTDDVTATFNFVPDPPEPFAGTTEIFAVTVNAPSVPVPATGAANTGLALPAALVLVLGGSVAIASSRRLGREG